MTPLPELVRAAFLRQAEACRALGSPFTADLCGLLAKQLDTDSAFGRRIASWEGDPGADALALRAAGALNALARTGRVPALTRAYPPAGFDAPRIADALAASLAAEDAFLTAYLDSAPQTNEVKRSGALIGALLIVAQKTGLPLSLLEIGASAGLNLGLERYGYALAVAAREGTSPVVIRCAWRGAHPDPATPLVVADRAGCDRNPLDPGAPADRERLLSYIWPDQPDRLETTAAACDVAAAAPWRVERADAADWIEARLAQAPRPGVVTVVFHTIVWQYLPAPAKARIEAALAAAAARASADAPLARVAMEADETRGSAALTLTLWPGGETQALARADFHGRWVAWE
ncbi:DUF2332 domain-containing protein [Salinarimonas rosea]|uniref:DUF2332 domain-containing protein n=1 Tax=Salinarimonas rosea TaxID=552063 RepID=UPI0003FFDDB7|nr:DUF2332 family protein [Salinarimonas rosea]